MLNDIIRATSATLPKFNDYLLKDYRDKQLNTSPDFISIIFTQAMKLFKDEIEYVDYRILNPEERAQYELNNSIPAGQVNVKKSEWILVEYIFKYESETYKIYIYFPYFHNNKFIVIDNTQYNVQLAISEKVFTKIKNGITAKVVRSPIRFWRNKTQIMQSVTSGKTYFQPIITVKIHNNRRSASNKKKAPVPTVIHYLLCRYGLNMTLKIFNIKEDEVYLTDHIDQSDNCTYEYFLCRKKTKTVTPIYLKAHKRFFTANTIKEARVIASIIYLLTHFKKYDIEHLYNPSNTAYKIMLGKLIHGTNVSDAMVLNYITNHLRSLDSYLDPITQGRLNSMGIYPKDIYDLFIYIFLEIDMMLINIVHSDLYDKRIDILDNLLVSTIVTVIYYKFYAAESRNRCNSKVVGNILRINSKKIKSIYTSKLIRMNPSRYNDNWLLSVGSKKIRLHNIKNDKSAGGSLIHAPEHRFHPSFGYVESLIAFSQSNPGSSGTINPFLSIAEDGSIIKEQYADQFDVISKYLPYQTPQSYGEE